MPAPMGEGTGLAARAVGGGAVAPPPEHCYRLSFASVTNQMGWMA
jgi:hypothetical protein